MFTYGKIAILIQKRKLIIHIKILKKISAIWYLIQNLWSRWWKLSPQHFELTWDLLLLWCPIIFAIRHFWYFLVAYHTANRDTEPTNVTLFSSRMSDNFSFCIVLVFSSSELLVLSFYYAFKFSCHGLSIIISLYLSCHLESNTACSEFLDIDYLLMG